jgi:[ribosomal protein S5]-alanine N-acetyltransferase
MLDIHFATFPNLETARLQLCEIVPADAERFYALRRDPLITQYLDRDDDRDLAAVHSLILSIRQSLDQGDGITWGLRLRDTSELVGSLGFWRIDKKNHRAEIGYILAPAFWGVGLMSEAMEAVLAYGFGQLHLHSVEANTAVGNTSSQKLLEKHGFLKEAHFRQDWYYNGVFSDSLIYCKLASDR